MFITGVIVIIEFTDNAGNLRTITPAIIGWMFYLGSQLLNFIYYKMHPSSPKMWTWGKKEMVEDWTLPPEETQTQEKKGELKLN